MLKVLVMMAAVTATDDPVCERLDIAIEESQTLIQVMKSIEAVTPHIKAVYGSERPSESLKKDMEAMKEYRKSNCS